ncbi:MAG: alpha/beta hydrolase [Polyangiales bacterium]
MEWSGAPKLLAQLASMYVLVTFGACAAHRSMLFPAPPREVPPRGDGIEWLEGHDGTGPTFALCGFAQEPSAPTIVHFHGNGEQVAWHARFAREAQQVGVSYCAVEYPGYGMLSQRSISESAIYTAAEAVIRQLKARGISDERLVISGQSIGTGVATEMARRGHGSRLVLLSPYTSIVDVTQRIAVVLPATLFVRDRFDTRSKAPHVNVPVLIVHGALDTLIPVEMGRGLARVFPRAQYVELERRGHNDLFAEQSPQVWPMILDFARGRPVRR